jgi:S1-C subfamily serine protease
MALAPPRIDLRAARANLSPMRTFASLLLASSALAGAAHAQEAQSFRVINRTGEVAIGLYANEPGGEGRNLIAGRAMRPGQTAQITRGRGGCVVDVRLVTAAGTVFDRRGVDVCESPEVTVGAVVTQVQASGGGAVSPEAIAAVQRALASLGYDPGAPDGQMGPRTQSAIAAFQRERGLPQTGLLDGQTLAALRATAAGTPAQAADGKPPSVPQPQAITGAVAAGKPPPAAGPDRPQPIPGGRVAAVPGPGPGATPAQPQPRPGATQRASTGTGFVVAEGRILSNQHVIANCSAVQGLLPGGRRVPLSVQAADQRRDLALLSGPRDIGPALAFRDGPPRRGDEVVTYGFPLTGILGSGPTLTTGEVSALTGLRDDPNTMIISAPVQSGNSGGPLLDRSGNVLGVIVAKLNALRVAERTGGDLPQNVNFAIHGRVAQEFLRANGITPRTAASSGFRPAAEIGEVAHPSTVLIECMR